MKLCISGKFLLCNFCIIPWIFFFFRLTTNTLLQDFFDWNYGYILMCTVDSSFGAFKYDCVMNSVNNCIQFYDLWRNLIIIFWQSHHQILPIFLDSFLGCNLQYFHRHYSCYLNIQFMNVGHQNIFLQHFFFSWLKYWYTGSNESFNKCL